MGCKVFCSLLFILFPPLFYLDYVGCKENWANTDIENLESFISTMWDVKIKNGVKRTKTVSVLSRLCGM